MATLGYIGERLDLLVRQGATLGPFDATMQNPDGSAVNLIGATIRGQVRKKALDPTVVTDVDVTITDAALGKYSFGLSVAKTTIIPAGETIKDPSSLYVWDLEMVDALGRVIPLYYGSVNVFREVTRV